MRIRVRVRDLPSLLGHPMVCQVLLRLNLLFNSIMREEKKNERLVSYGGTESEFPPGPFACRPITPFPLV